MAVRLSTLTLAVSALNLLTLQRSLRYAEPELNALSALDKEVLSMLECDVCGATENAQGKRFTTEQGIAGHKQFAHPDHADHAEHRRSFAAQQQFTLTRSQLCEAVRPVIAEELQREVSPVHDRMANAEARLGALEADADQATAILERLESIEAQLAAADGLLTAVKAAQEQSHPGGLCGDQECAPCVAQAQIITNTAYSNGQEDVIKRFDEALLLAGGEPLRERVTLLLSQGLGILQQREQKFIVIDDRVAA